MSRAIGIINHDHSYIHVQGLAMSVWTIAHNLKRFPSVSVVDSGNTVVYGYVKYIDSSNITITFNATFSGKAYLN